MNKSQYEYGKEKEKDMSGYQKGRIKISQETCNVIELLSDDIMVAQIISNSDEITPSEIANANHIVDCWNAFEKDGLVENLRKQLKEYSLAIQKLAPRNSKMEEFLTKGK